MKFNKNDHYENELGGTIDVLSVDGDNITYRMTSGNCYSSSKYFTEKMLNDNGYVKVVIEE